VKDQADPNSKNDTGELPTLLAGIRVNTSPTNYHPSFFYATASGDDS
jgi:hypothetical protein